MVFDQYRVIEAELDQGYWVDTVTLSNDMREGSRLVITRKSDFGARVQITGERNATELVKGLTYTFGMLGGRWQLLQTQGRTAAIPSQTQAQSGGMNVPQSETFQRKSWYAVKLDNSWYALTDSSDLVGKVCLCALIRETTVMVMLAIITLRMEIRRPLARITRVNG